MLSEARYAPPFVKLPEGSRPVTNLAGFYLILNPFAATKLRYWTIYRSPSGEYRARFNHKHDEPVAQFGAFTIIHLHPQPGDAK